MELLQLCEVRGLPLLPQRVVLRVRPFGEEVGLSFSLTRGSGDFNPREQIFGYVPNFGESIKYFFCLCTFSNEGGPQFSTFKESRKHSF